MNVLIKSIAFDNINASSSTEENFITNSITVNFCVYKSNFVMDGEITLYKKDFDFLKLTREISEICSNYLKDNMILK